LSAKVRNALAAVCPASRNSFARSAVCAISLSVVLIAYSQKEQKHSITKAVLAPMKAVKKMLVSMELHLDASIDKLDNLAMNVQLDRKSIWRMRKHRNRQSRRGQKLSE